MKPDTSSYGGALRDWVAAELCDLYRRPAPQGGGLLMGGLMYGDAYVSRFLSWTAKTIQADFDALKGRARIVLFTDAGGFDKLWQYARRMEFSGIPTQVFIVPGRILDGLEEGNKRTRNLSRYKLLGAVQNLLTQIAGRYGCGFHALFPDMIYSAGYFGRLLKLAETHKGIAHSNISAGVEVIGEVAQYSRNGMLAIPALDLGDMAFRHMHKRSRGNLMNRGREWLGFPASHCLIWQAKDRLRQFCCHSNATYIAPEWCAKATVRYFSPIDCNLPYLLDDFYTPRLEDGMAMMEVSDDTYPASNSRVSAEKFAAICWYHVQDRDDYLPYFATPNDIPIRDQREYLDLAEIDARQADIHAGIIALKDEVKGRFIVKEAA